MNRTTIDLCSLLYVPLLQPAPLCAGHSFEQMSGWTSEYTTTPWTKWILYHGTMGASDREVSLLGLSVRLTPLQTIFSAAAVCRLLTRCRRWDKEKDRATDNMV